VIQVAQRLIKQFSTEQLRENFRDRNRNPADTAFHIFRVAQMGVEAANQTELKFESFNELAPKTWSAEDLAAWGGKVREQVMDWWRNEPQRDLQYLVPTYYGKRTMHDVLERTTWHAAQHTRQITLMLETYGVVPDRPLSAEDLRGLPVPDEVWDR
ncbi:MAG: hypothetical protein RLZZ192_1410, partial [Pseudomonadota bacterium]